MTQLFGIVRYEVLMQWRRRTFLLLAVFFIVGVIGLSGITDATRQVFPQQMQRITFETTANGEQAAIVLRDTGTGELTTRIATGDELAAFPRWLQDINIPLMESTATVLLLLAPSLLVLLLALPPMLAELLPLEQHYKVRELLDATSVGRSKRIFGKLLSVLLGVAAMLLVSLIAAIAFGTAKYGQQDLAILGLYGLLVLFPAAAIIAAYSVLLGGLAKTRRGGILIGLATMGLSIALAVPMLAEAFTKNPIFAPVATGQYESYGAVLSALITGTLNAMLPFALGLIAAWIALWWVERRRMA
ncbi:MAG: hypothetical protein U0670_02985 [Anaerolineae bacterium]